MSNVQMVRQSERLAWNLKFGHSLVIGHWSFVIALLIALSASAFAQNAGPAEAGHAEDVRMMNVTAVAGKAGMTTAQAIVLGVVEGVTEYLPVSSTGHLIVAQRMMGIGEGGDASAKQAADAYAICIQGGAILAVLLLYMRRAKQMWQGMLGRNPDGRRLLVNIIAGFVPAAVIGLATHKYIERFLMGGDWGLWPTVGAWFVGGVAILAVAWWRKAHRESPTDGQSLEQLAWKAALLIGFLQCIAMWPGVSRSLVTIVGGVLVGLSLPAAVEFSFLLGVVTLGAATLYDGMKHGELMLHTYGPVSLIVGFVVAAISAAVAVKWMVAYLNKHGLQLFGYYRIAIAVVVAALFWYKVL